MASFVTEKSQSVVATPRKVVQAPVRVAVIGCGRIAQEMHLPVLAGHEQARLVALVDRDLARARQFAKAYAVPYALADVNDLPWDEIDAAVIASPPAHHAPCALHLIGKGVHVLVEKPMATRYADAVRTVEAARQAGLVLAVGFMRRLYPSVRLLKALVAQEAFGPVGGFHVAGGGFYSWQSATLANMRRDLAGGGALMDYGSHLLDMLVFVLPGSYEVLDYRDNSLGGVEADCFLSLRVAHKGRDITGQVEVARTREPGNFVRIRCQQADLECHYDSDRYSVYILPAEAEAEDITGGRRPYRLQAQWHGEKERSRYERFRAELDDWLTAIVTGSRPHLDGASALAAHEIIEASYQKRQESREPWVETWPAGTNLGLAGQYRRILITGATGFIGCRVAEMLHVREGVPVRALVHSPARAARLARLPVELVQGDLADPGQVRQMVEGCDAVVHCAIGREWGDPRRIFDITVGGTKRLAEAALAAGVKRFVHVSTISVMGPDTRMTGEVDETWPIAPERGNVYGESKAAAEWAIHAFVRRGLPAVVVRPARVYGPFSTIFITRPIQALALGKLRLFGTPDGPANMVYVDNVVELMLRTLQAPAEKVVGEVFLSCDEDEMTWQEFYGYFAEELGLEPPGRGEPPAYRTSRRWQSLKFWRWPVAFWRGVKEIVRSPECKAFGGKILRTDPIGTVPRWIIFGIPGMERLARKLVGADSSSVPVYRRESPQAEDGIVYMGSAGVRYRTEKARRVLAFAPLVDRQRALQLTLEWIRYARLVEAARS
ncbi:MAG: hypothetical protein C4297_01095 [Gemmataceae bacterium]